MQHSTHPACLCHGVQDTVRDGWGSASTHILHQVKLTLMQVNKLSWLSNLRHITHLTSFLYYQSGTIHRITGLFFRRDFCCLTPIHWALLLLLNMCLVKHGMQEVNTWMIMWLGDPGTLWRVTSGAFSLCCKPIEVRGWDLKAGEAEVSGNTNNKPTDTSTHTKVLSLQAHLREQNQELLSNKNICTYVYK